MGQSSFRPGLVRLHGRYGVVFLAWSSCDGARRHVAARVRVAHNEGSYFADPATLADMERRGQIILRYCDASGGLDPAANPNGAMNAIAGICNAEGNVFGLMPHPERCAEALIGGEDGRLI